MPTKLQQRSAASAAGSDPAISDVQRGISAVVIGSEDERRANGTDASTAEGAGEHDDSPEANKAQAISVTNGGTLDAYAGMPAGKHPNLVGEAFPLVVGQAPVGRAAPLTGSKNIGEEFHPEIPNAINQSPLVRGVEDPKTGKRTEAPDFADLKADLLAKEKPAETEAQELKPAV